MRPDVLFDGRRGTKRTPFLIGGVVLAVFVSGVVVLFLGRPYEGADVETADSGGPVAVEPTAPPGPPRRTDATPAPPAVTPDVVADFVRRLVPASVAYAVPESLTRGTSGQVTLRLAPASVPPTVLEARLRSELGGRGSSTSGVVRISSRMRATLTADQPCEIVLSTPPADRAVAFTEGATWTWSVTPTRATGDVLDLTVALTAPIVIDGVESSYSVGVYRKSLRVQVTYWDTLGDAIAWVAASWAPLAALATGVAAVYAWLRRSARRKARQPGFR